MKDKAYLTNIHQYQVDDAACELLCRRAQMEGIRRVLLGPSSIEKLKPLIKQWGLSLAVSVSYPSGAFFPDQKAEEIASLISLHPEIEELFVVSAVGRFLSGYHEEIANEMKQIRTAANGRNVGYMIEAALFSPEQMDHLCRLAVENGLDAIVSTTGFAPYKVPFPSADDLRNLVKAAGERIEVIAGGCFQGPASVKEALSSGANTVITDHIDYLLG